MTDRLNILFLFSDQHRGDWMPYDEETFRKMNVEPLPIRMPNLRALMDRGTTFTRHICNSPVCVPARACLASGMHYDRCEVYNNDYCVSFIYYNIYSTAFFTKISRLCCVCISVPVCSIRHSSIQSGVFFH